MMKQFSGQVVELPYEVSCQYSVVKELGSDDERDIADFLKQCPGFSYFQSPAFFRVCRTSKHLEPFYILARERGELVGVLLFFKQVQTSVPLLSFLTSRVIIWGGPVVKNNSPQLLEGILKAYRQYCPAVLYTQVRNLTDTGSVKEVFEKENFQYEDHLNILVDLDRPEEALWKDVYTKRRNQIRRAEKEGCVVVLQQTQQALSSCYSILQEVYHRARLPLPAFNHFEELLRHSDEQTGLRILTVQWEGEIIGCMLCLVYGEVIFDYYAGAFSRHYKKYPNDLLPWATFKWAKENGFKQFDFGGAGKPDVPYGVRDYKKQFGGEMVCYGRYEKIHSPLLFGAIKQLFTIWQVLKR